MRTVAIGLKDFRRSISRLAREAKKQNTAYIITVRNKPVFEVRPNINATAEEYDFQIDYYRTVENSLSFWKGDADDSIFSV